VYTSGLERRRTVALLRALGAGRGTVFALVLLETGLTVTLGALLGIGLSLLVSRVGGNVLGQRLGFTLAAPELTWPLASRALGLIPLASPAGEPAAAPALSGAFRWWQFLAVMTAERASMSRWSVRLHLSL